MPRNKAVITGLGVLCSIGTGSEEYFEALLAGKSGIRSLADRTDDEAKPGTVNKPGGLWIGGPIVDFEAKQHVKPRKALKVMCREIRTAYVASQIAVQHAGLDQSLPASLDGKVLPADVATIFGGEMYYGPPLEMRDSILACFDQETIDPETNEPTLHVGKFGAAAKKEVMPLWMLKFLPNMPACHVGISVNAHGPNNTQVVGDTSGPAALIESISCIERGLAKVVINGVAGTRISTTRMNYRNDLPIGESIEPVELSSRPHDPDSVGVIGGEAAGVLIVESIQHAKERGANVLAAAVGYASRFVGSGAMTSGKRTAEVSDSECRGSSKAIRLAIDAALADAAITAEQVGLIVSHGGGDPVIDAAERAAIAGDFDEVPMIAPIGAIGHTGAASGQMAIITGVLCLMHKKIPPTINASRSSAGANLLEHATQLQSDYVLCLSHTSEGNAVAVVLSTVDS